jgi:hypothetical protein
MRNSRPLTPESLTFESFRHSQGNVSLQYFIFGYVEGMTGMRPNLTPSAEENVRYGRFLLGAAPEGHVKVDEVGAVIEASFKQLRAGMQMRTEIDPSDPGFIIRGISTRMISKEQKLLTHLIQFVHETEITDDIQAAKVQRNGYRMRQRVLSGKTSYLYHYGRDANPTGYETLDRMYADTWEVVETGSQEGSADHDFINEHAVLVRAADRLVLGGEPLDVPDGIVA